MAAPAPRRAQAPEPPNGPASTPTAAAQAKERERPPEAERLTTEKTGSDFMVDVCKTLNLDYIAVLPRVRRFAALQESFINYGANKRPEWLTCLHEEVVGRHGAWLCQGRRQTDGRDHARHRRHAARGDGDL